jgi:hypothetical protein
VRVPREEAEPKRPGLVYAKLNYCFGVVVFGLAFGSLAL